MSEEDQKADGLSSGAKSFEDLEVFRKAYRLSLDVHRASLTFPRMEQFALGDQIRRASKSICANLAEGFGKQSISKPEFKRFVAMALGSADEMRVWIRYCADLGYVEPAQCEAWRAGYGEVARMLSGLHRKI